MNKSKTWKQLTMKQVRILFDNTELVTDWERKFILSLKNTKFKVSNKQMLIVNKILGKLGAYNLNYRGSLNKGYAIDAWSRIENGK